MDNCERCNERPIFDLRDRLCEMCRAVDIIYEPYIEPMSLPPAKRSKSFDPVPAGNHVARLYDILHLGTIPTNWQGTEKMTDKIRLTFELSNERKEFKEGEGEKPFSISREFTYSWGTKGHLRPFVEGMGGIKLMDEEAYNFDLEVLLGQPCLLNVVHTEGKEGNVYSNIQNATPLPKGMTAPELFNQTQSRSVNNMPFEEIDELPEFLQKKVKSSEEYQGRVKHNQNMEEAGLPSAKANRPKSVKGKDEKGPDDIPF